MTAKTRGIDAGRENEKCNFTLSSSSYATTHGEKNLEDRPKSAKISLFGQNEHLMNFRLYEQFQKKSRGYKLDEAIPHTIIACKVEQNDLPNPYFLPVFP